MKKKLLWIVLLTALLTGLTWAVCADTALQDASAQPVLTAAKATKKPKTTATPKPTATPRATATPFPTVYERKGIATFVNGLKNHKALDLFSYAEDAQLAEIWFPLITDADCTLIKCGDETLMIDCGTSSDYQSVVELLNAAGVDTVDRLLITHPHHDHLGSFKAMANAGLVKEVLVCHDQRENQYMSNLYTVASECGIKVTQLKSGQTLTLGRMDIELWMLQDTSATLNERSAVLKLTYGRFAAIFMADIEEYAMKELVSVKGAEWLSCDLLRYPHHGASSMPAQMSSCMAPKLTVVTAGRTPDRAGKTCAKTISRYTAFTDSHIIQLTTDGKNMVARYVTEYVD